MFWFKGQGLKGLSGDSVIKKPPEIQEIQVQSPGWKDTLENKMATHFSGLETPWGCLGNPMDRGAWRATVHGVTKESDTSQ